MALNNIVAMLTKEALCDFKRIMNNRVDPVNEKTVCSEILQAFRISRECLAINMGKFLFGTALNDPVSWLPFVMRRQFSVP